MKAVQAACRKNSEVIFQLKLRWNQFKILPNICYAKLERKFSNDNKKRRSGDEKDIMLI